MSSKYFFQYQFKFYFESEPHYANFCFMDNHDWIMENHHIIMKILHQIWPGVPVGNAKTHIV